MAAEVRRAAVIGTGTMGPGMGAVLARQGIGVTLYDVSAEQLEKAKAGVGLAESVLDRLEAPRAGGGSVRYTHDLPDALDGVDFVLEAVPERLELKRKIFAQLEQAAPADAILATNSSSYASRPIVAGLSTTERMLNTHFYMPPQKIAVDVMSCGNTAAEVIDFVMTTYPEYGLRPFLARKESTGFIYNRIWAAIKREALQVVYEGVSTPEDIDAMYSLQTGAPGGPFRSMDRVGLDVVYDIEEHYVAENPHLPEGPRKVLREYLDAGKLGVKTGEGFYSDYPKPAQG
ncbi:MAG: 3-hydroxyacyl-CoA dehydrogenase family protein [Aldersonia sp.]|nr:3-hydroxyacyl-CoA dehydrogenase family protein [Aldersonia sp.]